MSGLPGILAELAEVAGAEAAWALVAAKGGTTVYIPRAVPADHWLVEVVGREAAAKICKHFASLHAGTHIQLPTTRVDQQRRRLIRALEAGASASQAALEAGMHERSAYRNRKRLKDKQPKLL